MIKILSILIICTLVAFGLVILSDNDKDEKVDSKRIAVKTANVIYKELSIPVYSSGILQASIESKLSFKIPGVLDKVFIHKGDLVKKGQLLAQLDLIEIKSGVNQAHSAYNKAKRDFERVNNLFKDSVATLEQFQNAETGLEIASAALKAAKFNLRYSQIHAPSYGKILHQFAEEHEFLGAGMPLFLFGSIEGSWVINLGVTDREVVNLQIGDSADVVFDAYPDKKYFAHISEIGGSANPMTGTFEIQLRVDKNTESFFSGFVANVNIFPHERKKYSLIPAESLFEATGDEGFVYHVLEQENRVEKINIKIDNIIDGQLAVSKGLKGVKQVVTDGTPYLRDGSEIVVVQ